MSHLQVLAERESIYRLLAQTTPENLNKDYKSYTIDPTTRYVNLNRNALSPKDVINLYDVDDEVDNFNESEVEIINVEEPASDDDINGKFLKYFLESLQHTIRRPTICLNG